MRCCIQNAVNTMEMKDSRSGSRGPDHHWGGGLRDRGPGSYMLCTCSSGEIPRIPQEHLLSIQLQRCCRWLQDELPDTQIQIWNEIPNSANPVSSFVKWRRFSAPQLWNISRYSVYIGFVKTLFSCPSISTAQFFSPTATLKTRCLGG